MNLSTIITPDIIIILIGGAIITTVVNLLKKKFKVQTDKGIYLLIHIEENTEMELDKLIDFVKKEKVPYGAIYISGLISNIEPIARFFRIYPDFSTYQRNLKYFI